jgi:hypothetical protein
LVGLGLQLGTAFPSAAARRLEAQLILYPSPNLLGFLFAPPQEIADAVLVLKMVRDRTTYLAKTEAGKIIWICLAVAP